MIDLTPLIQAVITLAAAAITAFVIPFIKSKIDAEKWSKYLSVIDVLVEAAEQMYGANASEKKLTMVKEWLEERGYTVDEKEIEAAVLKLHAGRHNYTDAHNGSSAPTDATETSSEQVTESTK